MGIKEWYKYSSGNRSHTIRLGESNYDMTQAGWRSFWRKIRKEKKRKTLSTTKNFSSSVTFQASYDPNAYSKNFDQGMGWMEPDNLSRSFSARFADPSRLFPRSTVLLD
ncbi:hypothetical protein UlMin_035000 [Ulmus minor]